MNSENNVKSKKNTAKEWIISVIIIYVVFMFIRIFIGLTVVTSGESMLPTLKHGDRIFVEKVSYFFSSPKKGQIITFPYPANPEERYIKRIIGTPGDVISIENNYIYVNGIQLDDDFSGPLMAKSPTNIFPLTIPDKKYFVLGDNRGISRDSRYPEVGLIEKKDIIGRAFFIFYPFNHFKFIK